MNYFERLVRRALLQPAVRPGAAFDDPFERTADWLLEPTAARVSPPPTPDQAGPETATRLDTSPAEITPVRPDATISPSLDAPAPAHAILATAPTLVQPVDPGPVVAAEVRYHAPVVPSEIPQEVAPLAHADAFLRSLGVRVPAQELAAPIPAIAPDAMPVDRAPVGDPPRDERPAVLMPPAPTMVPRPSTEAAPVAAGTREFLAANGERSQPDKERPRPAVTTREVVVIDRRSSDHQAAVRQRSGVGAPHVGLGQL